MVNWIESPPLISSISENEAIIERLRSAQSWNILKDKKSDYIFVTRKRLINWSNLSELTSVSQMTRHVFCTKVPITTYTYLFTTSYLLIVKFGLIIEK